MNRVVQKALLLGILHQVAGSPGTIPACRATAPTKAKGVSCIWRPWRRAASSDEGRGRITRQYTQSRYRIKE